MKTFLKLLVSTAAITCLIFLLMDTAVFADQLFSRLKDDEKLVQTEGDGYLGGNGIVTTTDENGKVIEVIDLDHLYENGSKVITGKQYKDDFQAKQSFAQKISFETNDQPMKSGLHGEGVVTTTDENGKVIESVNLSSISHKISEFFSNIFN